MINARQCSSCLIDSPCSAAIGKPYSFLTRYLGVCGDSAKTNGLHLFSLRVSCLLGIIRTVFKALDCFFVSSNHVVSLIYPILKVSYTRHCFTQDLILQCHRPTNIQLELHVMQYPLNNDPRVFSNSMQLEKQLAYALLLGHPLHLLLTGRPIEER